MHIAIENLRALAGAYARVYMEAPTQPRPGRVYCSTKPAGRLHAGKKGTHRDI